MRRWRFCFFSFQDVFPRFTPQLSWQNPQGSGACNTSYLWEQMAVILSDSLCGTEHVLHHSALSVSQHLAGT